MTEAGNVIDLRPKPDCFGSCPTCYRNNGYLNIGREHWFICHKHRVKWCAAENLFSGWRDEPDLEWQVNAARIGGYREVEPVLQERDEVKA